MAILFPASDYLCVDLIQKEDLSLSSKENKDPVEKPTTKLSKHKSNPQQKVSDGEKGSTNTGCQEENDDVFLQYMPQNTDKVIESEETKEESRGNRPVCGCNSRNQVLYCYSNICLPDLIPCHRKYSQSE